MKKTTFIKIISLIQEQDAIDRRVGKALEQVCDSWVMLNCSNKQYEALMLLLREVLHDTDDLIGWWLWEDVEKQITLASGKKVVLKTAEQLYDYLCPPLKGITK